MIFNRRIWTENFSSLIPPIYHIKIRDILLKDFELELNKIHILKRQWEMELKIKILVRSFISAEQLLEENFPYENLTIGIIVNSYLTYL